MHASKLKLDEVNFWRPSPTAGFGALEPGEILLFKLHAPRNYIAGGGFFTRFLHLRISLAWEAFEEANGVGSLAEMRDRIAKYRRAPIGPTENPPIGCILLAEPFFWAEEDWIPYRPISASTSCRGEAIALNLTPAGLCGRRCRSALHSKPRNRRTQGQQRSQRRKPALWTAYVGFAALGPSLVSSTGNRCLRPPVRDDIGADPRLLNQRCTPLTSNTSDDASDNLPESLMSTSTNLLDALRQRKRKP